MLKPETTKAIQGLSTYGVRSMASSVLASLRDGAPAGSLITFPPLRADTEGDRVAVERCRSERCDNMASRMPAGQDYSRQWTSPQLRGCVVIYACQLTPGPVGTAKLPFAQTITAPSPPKKSSATR